MSGNCFHGLTHQRGFLCVAGNCLSLGEQAIIQCKPLALAAKHLPPFSNYFGYAD